MEYSEAEADRNAAGLTRIVLCSDGTGNSSANLFRTNVWRLYQALDLSKPDQIAKYDDGVGTSGLKPLAILGGVFGYGLARNVQSLYAFLCRHYKPGDEIYAFGFSRGAFTVRVLSGLIASQGVITDYKDEVDLQRKVRRAFRDYRRSYEVEFAPLRRLTKVLRDTRDTLTDLYDRLAGYSQYKGPNRFRSTVEDAGNTRARIDFLGVWDTVDAYGLPVDEMTRAWDKYIWPLTMRDRSLREIVDRARHALALDDERNTFHPLLWAEDGSDEEFEDARRKLPGERRVLQVWFAGVHSNVGGGYPIDSLSHVPLVWMMDEIAAGGAHGANCKGLSFVSERFSEYRKAADPLGPIYDSRRGLGAYYRYQPRRFELLARAAPPSIRRAISKMAGKATPSEKTGAPDGGAAFELNQPILHHSVVDRLEQGIDNYAPVIISSGARVLTRDGRIEQLDTTLDARNSPLTSSKDRAARIERQVDNWVWLRRVVYFATLFVTLFFAAGPFYLATEKTGGDDPTKISGLSAVPEVLGGLIPKALEPWVAAYSANPKWFFGFACALIGLNFISNWLKDTINSRAGLLWRPRSNTKTTTYFGLGPPKFNNIITTLRLSKIYKLSFRWLKGTGLPLAFLLLFAYSAIAGAARLYRTADPYAPAKRVDVLDPTSCAEPEPREASENGVSSAKDFDARCKLWPSGIELKGGQRYELTLTMDAKPAPNSLDALCFAPFPAAATDGDNSRSANDHGWWDGGYRADVFGLAEWSERSIAQRLRGHLTYAVALPLRRHITSPWLTPFVQVGSDGRDVKPLAPKIPPARDPQSRNQLVAEFTAHRSGKLYLYLNDAIDLPCLNFYRNNKGSASVKVRELGWDVNYNR